MASLPDTITESHIWRSTLAERANDDYQEQREKLRSSFIETRQKVAVLANEIRKDLPELTLHDISHIDALWEMSSQIVGEDYLLTPVEGYMLGVAFLFHDLGLAVAASKGGLAGLRQSELYKDIASSFYKDVHKRLPTSEELCQPEPELDKRILFTLLRQTHAERSEELAFLSYELPDGTQIQLIDNVEIRQTFGRHIGKIAHSHWWSLEQVEKELSQPIGAPSWAPSTWTADPLVLASILRVSDAAHIDARRAPIFLRAFSQLGDEAIKHWTFQSNLTKPYLNNDALTYTSGKSFPPTEADAWWLCYEAIKVVDRELRSVDALLSEERKQRFSARRAAGVDSPERLATYIRTESWLPINAIVHISDLPHIIKSIGGDELYGKDKRVPLRELIQNACDATIARRFFEGRNQQYGEIEISISVENDHHILEVRDTGIGMSKRVLTDCLLNFGKSLWKSSLLQEELPGLATSEFESCGKYGIGFFSVFMAAGKVQVITRRCDTSTHDTMVLEFGQGLSGRPNLRQALKNERLIDGGTIVRIQLLANPYEKGGMLCDHEGKEKTLGDFVNQIAPASNVRLVIRHENVRTVIQEANDWKSISSIELLERIQPSFHDFGIPLELVKESIERAATNLTEITTNSGEVVGRACIVTPEFSSTIPMLGGVLSVGGLFCSPLGGICGIIQGESQRAARDQAQPLASQQNLVDWAEDQEEYILQLYEESSQQASCAQVIRILGGNAPNLPIAQQDGKWITFQDIVNMDLPDSIVLIDNFSMNYEFKNMENITLNSNVFVSEYHGMPAVFQNGGTIWSYPEGRKGIYLTLGGAVLEALAENWKVSLDSFLNTRPWPVEKNILVGRGNDTDLFCDGFILKRPASSTQKLAF